MWKRTVAGAAILTASLAAMPATAAPAQAHEAAPLPAVSFRLGCVDNGAEATAAEIDGIQALHDFVREHDGQVVWLDAVITADAGAGGCSRSLAEYPKQPWPTGERARIDIDPCVRKLKAGHCWREGMTDIRAMGPPLAYSHSVVLPGEKDLPVSLPYRMGGYGEILNYQGPFIARFFEGTGYAYVTFSVPDPALPGVWERARCNARPQSCGAATGEQGDAR